MSDAPPDTPKIGDEQLRGAAPAYVDLEAKRARAGVMAALFGDARDEQHDERLTVGRYRIDTRLGAGGMGVVYRAHDPELDRPVAVKLLHNESASDDKARARMLREARSLAKLSHPNVITVYDVGTDDGQVFVAMELVAGRDLRGWLDQHRNASWREILALFVAAGHGLAAAHEVGLVHRDFKPENVLVGDDGRVRVLDFGLARAHEGDAGVGTPVVHTADGELALSPGVIATDGEGVERLDVARLPTSALSRGLTETGALIGTPLYMAPELYAGQAADVRSDQFAFCASLYEGLYHQLPFGSRNLTSHVEAVRTGKLVPPPEDTAVASALWPVIARGLAHDPAARWPDMSALLDQLERLAHEPIAAATTQPRRWWWAVAAIVLAAGAGFAAVELADQRGGNGVAAASIADSQPTITKPEQPTTTATELDEADDPEPAKAPPLPQPPASETDGQTEAEAEPEPEATIKTAEIETELHGWCHLHEDRYTLLERSARRRASFVHQGHCYTCRVESRRDRTRSFSPRDCAGYSLCGEASADACN